jgi:hypothetical protein
MQFCIKCGTQNTGHSKFCTKCGNTLKPAPIAAQTDPVLITEAPVLQKVNTVETSSTQPNKKKMWLIIGIATIALIGGFLSWYFIFNKDEPLYVKFVLPQDLKLRSNQFDGSDANIITAVRYGSEIMVLKEEGEWSSVKVNEQTGFMKSKYLATGRDFFETDAIVRSCGINDTINETRFKRSLLNYFRKNNYTWQVAPDINKKYFNDSAAIGKTMWRIKETKLYEKTIVRGKFNGLAKKGIACIIENEQKTQTKLLVFIYDENENEIKSAEYAAPNFATLGIAEANNLVTWYINGAYTTLFYEGIAAYYAESDESSLIYFNGNTIDLYSQPVEYGD